MIWICHVSLQLTFLKEKPVSSKDFKLFDDLDMSCQFAIDIFEDKSGSSKDFKLFDDLTRLCQFAIDTFEGKTRIVERFQGF